MSKRMLADVLWEAANESLSVHGRGRLEFSCLAALEVAKAGYGGGKVLELLTSLGCSCYDNRFTFGQPRGPKRQGVRYMWLLLAMHVAEDEGITV